MSADNKPVRGDSDPADDMPTAVDPLWQFAEESGLVNELGPDEVQWLIAAEFAERSE